MTLIKFLSLFMSFKKFIRVNPTPGLDNLLKHSIDIKLTTNLDIRNLVAFFNIKPKPIYYQ